mmetsp:Transcript_51006/g.124282  ORF Transcript_51006/g.124282 Transcript_51006/m.124282 type:complete len:127 (-) Transcript_51006:247-627(-)
MQLLRGVKHSMSAVLEDAMFGGQRAGGVTHPAAQRASGGMRIAQHKKRKDAPKDDPATLPNEGLEPVAKITNAGDEGLAPAEVRQFTRLQKQRVENQQPKKDKALATQNRPNPKKTGPIQQPRPGF